MIDTVDRDDLVALIKERLRVKALMIDIMNFKGDDIELYDEMVNIINSRGTYIYALRS